MRNPLVLCFSCLSFISALSAASSAQDNPSYERAIVAATERVAPSLVRIETLGGLDKVGAVVIGTGPTTGMIVAKNGLIISSAFNFAQKPSQILVYLQDGSRHPAKLIATDFNQKLVLLKIETDRELPVPDAAPVKELKSGQTVLALGRAFDADKPNLSVGILSAVGRIWGKAVQTDAKISPNNYGGPLVDLQGRVIGILTPLSPQGAGDDAGVEWYDSGIGFAVPLAAINRVLPRMEKGEDLHSGLLGISLKKGDIYVEPATLAAIATNSPASKADWKVGDTITKINDIPIARQNQLKHALGPLFAGDTIHVTLKRGSETIESDVPLVAKITAYQHPFLGIFPAREPDSENAIGLGLRGIYPNSPAAKAGLRPTDRIIAVGDKVIADRADLQESLHNQAPNQDVTFKLRRDGKTETVTAKLGKLPETLVTDQPPARGKFPEPPEADKPTIGLVTIKIPEVKNECVVFVPETYRSNVPHGLVIWLPAPGTVKDPDLEKTWKELAAKYDLLVVMPKSADPTKWDKGELDFIIKATNDVIGKYSIDRARVAAIGQDGGGAMAWLLAFQQRELVRGVAAINAMIPTGVKPPATDPLTRLYVLQAAPAKGPAAVKFNEHAKALREIHYPVMTIDTGDAPRALNETEFGQFARWVDSLDAL
jgi:serine protease Do